MNNVISQIYYGIGGLLCHKYIHRLMPVKFFLKTRWRQIMGGTLDFSSPKTFNEKLQWLKVYDRNPEYPILVDKILAKSWVAEKIGQEYVIPTLAVYDSVEEINFDCLPPQFALKCTHDSGGVFICQDKSCFNKEACISEIKKRLKYNYYWNSREWPYKTVKPRIIVEPFMADSRDGHSGLTDYKFTCFNGRADNVMVCIDRHINDTKFFFFNKEWHLLPYNISGLHADPTYISHKISKPECLEKMFELAGILSKGFPFMRVDFYCVNNHPMFGEITLYPCGGFDPHLLSSTDFLFGDGIDLSLAHSYKK